MQLYALNAQQHCVAANRAIKQKDYFCPECQSIVHVRGGIYRQNHFYHVETSRQCRQNGKSLEHLQLQLRILDLLPPGECFVEHRFPSMGRIADVFWLPQKIVFEIQCSPMSALEVMQRTQDYTAMGFTVVWILHDSRYNRYRLSAMELYLQQQPHYFSNIDAAGKGIIYDQFAIIQAGSRLQKLKRRPIDVTRPKRCDAAPKLISALIPVQKKLAHSNLYFANDVATCCLDQPMSEEQQNYAKEASQLEQRLAKEVNLNSATFTNQAFPMIDRWLLRPYRLLFQMLLEKACK